MGQGSGRGGVPRAERVAYGVQYSVCSDQQSVCGAKPEKEARRITAPRLILSVT